MQNSRIGSVCRSHNPFTPSVALYQQFVLPNRPHAFQSRLSSSTASAEVPTPSQNGIDHTPSLVAGDQNASNNPPIRKVIEALPFERRPPHQRRLIERISSQRRLFKNGLDGERRDFGDIMADDKAYAWKAWKQGYVPIAVTPVQVANEVDEWALPWSVRVSREGPTASGMERLARQIELFGIYARPTKFEMYARNRLINRVTDQAKAVLPGFTMEVYGSSVTGLALATSDIDFRIFTDPDENSGVSKKPPVKVVPYLHVLSGALRSSGNYTSCEVRRARYPLIHLHDENFGLDIQIVAGTDTLVAQSLTQNYLAEFPYLRDLYAVVKTMFEIRGLSDTYKGGFGGYPIFMMLVASLRLQPPTQANAAAGLMSFLKFWSTLDTAKKGITLEPPLIFKKPELPRAPGRPRPAYLLHFPDPAEPTNDLGRKGVSIKHVKKTLGQIYNRLQSRVEANVATNLLRVVVGPVFNKDLEQRNKLHDRGREVLGSVKAALANKSRSGEAKASEDAQLGQKPEDFAKMDEATPRPSAEEPDAGLSTST